MKIDLDKKFDNHFRSSFEDFEAMPSAESWQKISAELEKKPKKKIFAMWGTAASMLLLLSIGLGLYHKESSEDIAKPRHIAHVLNANSSAKELKIKSVKNESIQIIIPTADLKIAKTVKSASEKTSDLIINLENTDHQIVANEVLAASMPKEMGATINPMKNILTTSQAEISEINEQKVISNSDSKLVVANAFLNKEESIEEKVVGKRIKFSSVGDLVNLVVAQVDKRENKIIKISKTEESENEITGINLGLFKFNKAKK
jgi:hypothetical protein